MGKQTIASPSAAATTTADTIPEQVETLEDKLKLELTEPNLRHWLLGPFEKQKQHLNEVKKRMLEEGVSPELVSRCLHYESLPEESSKRETLKLTTNPKTNRLYTVSELQMAGQLSDAEIEGIRAEHGGREPPYYHVTSIRRVFDDRTSPHREHLVYTILFEGLCVGKRDGHINADNNMRINESAVIGYSLIPKISWNNMRDKDGQEKRVAVFNGRITDDGTSRSYEIPFSREVVEALMKHTKDGQGQVGLEIHHLSKSKRYGVKDINEFLTDDLPALIERYEKPPATYNFNVQPDKLAKYLQLDEAAKAEQKQYG